MKQRITEHGYCRVKIGGRNRAVHHLVLEAFVAARPPGLEGCHENGVPGDNRPQNLKWGTRLDNAADKRRHGTHNHTRQLTCRRRGHALIAANLEEWTAGRGGRKCYACKRGYADVVYYRRQGVHYDRDVLADQYYAWLMEDAPKPRSTKELHERALLPAADEGWRPRDEPPPAWTWTMCTTNAIRQTFTAGQTFTVPEAHRAVQALGVDVGANAVSLALCRGIGRGYVEKVARGRYRRLAEKDCQAA